MQVDAQVLQYFASNDPELIDATVEFAYDEKMWRVKTTLPRILHQSGILSFKLNIDANFFKSNQGGFSMGAITNEAKPIQVLTANNLNNWIIGDKAT